MALEALVERLCVALEENTAEAKVLNAGRAEALAKLQEQTGGAEAPKTTRTRKPKDEPAPETPAAAGAAGTRTMRKVDYTADGVYGIASGWLQEAGITPETQQERGGKIKAMLDHFGAPTIKGIADEEARYQATFYLERFKAGLAVNFAQEYDFDGDPLFDKTAEPAGADLLG